MTEAYAINDEGWIVGQAKSESEFSFHAFALVPIPVPEPETNALLLVGLLAVGVAVRAKQVARTS